MSQRLVRQLIISLLLTLNVFLGVYLLTSSRLDSLHTRERLNQVLALYEQAGITFQETPQESSRIVRNRLELSTADVDAIVEAFLGEEIYSKSYIYGSKVQYQKDDITILTNRPQHTITYTDESVSAWTPPEGLSETELTSMIQPLARRFAENWLGEVYLSEWRQDENGYRFVYRQMIEDEIYYFNTISLVVTMDGVRTAVITIWNVDGTGESLQGLPQDEMLYSGLIQITASSTVQAQVERVFDGYVIGKTVTSSGEQTAVAVPVQTIRLVGGKSVITRYSGEQP